MANTYTQLYVHIVFSTKRRRALLSEELLERVLRYGSGILAERGHKVLAAGGMPDHLHFVIGLNPAFALSDAVRDLKAGTSGLINREGWIAGRFEWQRGYGAFSCGRSGLSALCRYVLRQKARHRRRSFREEYLELLQRFGIEHDPRYALDEQDP